MKERRDAVPASPVIRQPCPAQAGQIHRHQRQHAGREEGQQPGTKDRLARYTGTRGSTQGERKDSNPAPKATNNDIFPIITAYSITYLEKFLLKLKIALNVMAIRASLQASLQV